MLRSSMLKSASSQDSSKELEINVSPSEQYADKNLQDAIRERKLHYRLWWPKHSSKRAAIDEYMLLVGWTMRGLSDSLDIVVAALFPLYRNESGENPRLPSLTQLQVITESAQTKLPLNLRDHAKLSLIGICIMDNNQECSGRNIHKCHSTVIGNTKNSFEPQDSSCKHKHKYDKVVQHDKERLNEYCNMSELRTGLWIKIFCQPLSMPDRKLKWIPKEFYLSQEGVTFDSAIHILLYEQPRQGSHHFACKPWRFLSLPPVLSLRGIQDFSSIPRWMIDLDQLRASSNLELVMLAINCTAAIDCLIQEMLKPLGTSCKQPHLFSIMLGWIKRTIAACMAVLSTLFYISAHMAVGILRKKAFSYVNIIIFKVFKQTSINVRIRRGQMLYWPLFLLEIGSRLQPNVSSAHHSSLLKHSLWSTVLVDIFVGSVVGFILLNHSEVITSWILQSTHSITDDLLRSGCVWLMGVPAGFKLNTELAYTFGMISLTIIQVWASLCFFIQPLLKYGIMLIAACGLLLGFTVQAALVIDILTFATFHISILHWFLALIYTHQIQLLASLMRLFRGRKRNPLRARIDSYDYSVEQHVVGSLIFTPFLLLLPTTSVFYIFFTILISVSSIVCMSFQILISVLHALPYAKIAIRLIGPKRFPSGIYLEQVMAGQLSAEIEKCHDKSVDMLSVPSVGKMEIANTMLSSLSTGKSQPFAVSVLGSNIASIGEIISPHLQKPFNGLSLSSGASCAYKIFSGGRIPLSLDITMPAPMPWISISIKEFWWLTYEAVLFCLL